MTQNADLDAQIIALEKKREPKSRHHVVMFSEIEAAPRKSWLVDGLLGAGELSCTYGAPGCGKSVLAGDLAAHVAAGLPWFGRRVAQEAVLYFAAERPALVMRRFAAIRASRGWNDLPLAVVSGGLDLKSNRTDANAIITQALVLQKIAKRRVGLIVLDTVSRALNGGDENSSKDMGALVATLAHIQQATDAHLLALHHVPHEQQRMRGHGALLAACDATLRVEKLSTVRIATLEKANDAIEGAKLAFTLASVELHRDPETGQITSAPVVEAADTSEAPSPTRKLSQRQRLRARSACELRPRSWQAVAVELPVTG